MYDYYDYGYDYGYDGGSGLAALGAGMLVGWLIAMAVSVFTIICNWKVFKKAGKPGWASIVPVYNTVVMIQIAELPMWYIALFFVPFANIYAMFKINIEIAKKFGKTAGFGVGMTLLQPVFYAILAFSKDVGYSGAESVTQPMYQQQMQSQPMQSQPMQSQSMYQQPVQPQPMYQQPVQPQPMYQQPVMPTPEVEPVQPQSTAPAFCTNCGNQLLPNTKFCTNCGKQI